MRTFSINTLGCKVNQYESQQIRELLERLGLEQAETPENKPELVVVNTCCVTHTASAKSRQYIRKAQKLNPKAVIIVCGCLPTIQIGELNCPDKNIRLIRHREQLAAELKQLINGKDTNLQPQNPHNCRNNTIRTKNESKIKCKNNPANQLALTQLTLFKGQTRAFLKVQDGCDGYCSYCIIPKTRPIVHSRPAEAVLEEAQRLVESGHKEIVVTGVFLGAYGLGSARRKNWPSRQNDNLANLLDKLAEIPGLARLRLSSLEPGDITGQLLDVFCRHSNIMPHLHLSLQSGSDNILKKMCRQYCSGEFKEKIALIKSRLDRPAITTDIIVGFPGETDDDFRQSVDLAKEVGFSLMHIFSFSAREGTAAAGLQGTINSKVIKVRSQILRDLGAELAGRFRRQFIGEAATVLTENSKNGQAGGRSERYFMVHIENENKCFGKNELVRVKLVEDGENSLIGRVG